MKRLPIVSFLFTVCLAFSTVWGQLPLGTDFKYHAQLKNAGSPASGPHDLRFHLFDALEGGVQVGDTVCADDVSVTDGLFTVPLDFGVQFAGQQRFLEIEVRTDTGLACGAGAGFEILAPRQALTATPYALFAQSGPVPLTLSGTSDTHIIRGENASTISASSGVFGVSTAATGATNGVQGLSNSSSENAAGVYGRAAAATGVTYGGRFDSDSTSGRAVSGYAGAASGVTYGVLGQSYSMFGIGVRGSAANSSGVNTGVMGDSFSADGYGGFFKNQSTTQRVELAGPNGAINTNGFLYREYTATTRSAAIPLAYGVVNADGMIASGTGNFTVSVQGPFLNTIYVITVTGESLAGSTAIITPFGADLSSSMPAWALSGGSLQARLYTGSGGNHLPGIFSFVLFGSAPAAGGASAPDTAIAQPTSVQPVCQDSIPETPAICSGNAVTDELGYATVRLPDGFEAFNRHFHYQLTVIDDGADRDEWVLTRVARAINGKQFTIRTSHPKVKVSWRIEAERQQP